MDYPRPQLQRSNWLSLSGQWNFSYDDDLKYGVPAEVKDWPLKIEVPFAPESTRSGVGDTSFHTVCWYHREFDYPVPVPGKVLLHFGAVDYLAHVWVNDVLVERHRCSGKAPDLLRIRGFATNDTNCHE